MRAEQENDKEEVSRYIHQSKATLTYSYCHHYCFCSRESLRLQEREREREHHQHHPFFIFFFFSFFTIEKENGAGPLQLLFDNMERKMPTETVVDGDADAAQALTTNTMGNPNNDDSCSSSASKLSEKKKPPRKKLTATKYEKPRKVETNIPWKNNYKIVEIVCKALDAMATKDSGNNERMGWTQLVGNESHACPYLYRKKKVSLLRAVTFVVGNDSKEANEIAKSVCQFLKNTKYLDKEKMPVWKRKLIDELKLDIQK